MFNFNFFYSFWSLKVVDCFYEALFWKIMEIFIMVVWSFVRLGVFEFVLR